MLFRVLCLVLLVTLSFCLSAAVEKKPAQEKKPTADMTNITSLLSRLVLSQHYASRPFDDALAETVFNDYLKKLDPLKMFFLKADVEKFAAANKKTLAKDLLRGNVDFAFEAYKLMFSRMEEYKLFADEFLKQNHSLQTQEEYPMEHDKSPWAETKEEMQNFWKKKLLYELITLHLADRAMQEDAEKKESPAAAEEQNNVPEELPAKKTPEERIRQRIERTLHYYRDLEPLEILEIYLTSVVQVFDPHSSYMSPRTNEEFDIEMSLSLVGIGAVLTTEDGYTKVVEIVAGGPADKQGELKAGDKIIAVRQENEAPVDVIDMPLNKVVSQIRGKENTSVTLTVLQAGKGLASPKHITIRRAKVELKESAARGEIREWKGKRFGVIVLPSFYLDFNAAKLGLADYRSASGDVKKILQNFHKEKLDGIVVDLRSNGGGSLREAIDLTGLFIKDGPVVQVRGRRDTEVQNDEDGGLVMYSGPLAVMINRFSASASEIFAAAIRDYGRGVVTGDEKSHGKGTVQFVTDLDRYMPYLVNRRFPAGSIRLTNAKFYRINGESTQLKGIASDVAFPSITDSMAFGEEKLDHALPWDTIPATGFEAYTGKWFLNDVRREELRKRSAVRVAESAEFRQLRNAIKEYDKIKERKTVTLNLEERWEEYKQQKKLHEEQEQLLNAAGGAASRDSKEQKKDIYLDETLNVLLDLIEISAQKQQKKAF